MDPEEQARLDAEQAARDEAARVAAEAEKSKKDKSQDDATAELERLRGERDAALAEAAKFAGIDPEKAKADAKRVAEAEKAKAEAEKAKAQAEGNFEKLRELQAAETQAQIDAALAERDAARNDAATAQTEAQKARAQAAFAASTFLSQETIYSPAKAEKLYGDHVAWEEDKLVVYDAPEGAAKRTKLMDTKGNPLPFDAAMKKIVEADPEKDTILKSKLKPGAGSKTDIDAKTPSGVQADRLARLAEGLKKLRGN